jgi:hypothetical protein
MPTKTPPKNEGFTTVLSSNGGWFIESEKQLADAMETCIIKWLEQGFEEGDEIDITTLNQQNQPITENFVITEYPTKDIR